MNLRDLFRHFLDDEILIRDVLEIDLTAMHLRLLLQPLQGLVYQYCQLLYCFRDSMISRSRNRALTAASIRVRLEEAQALLGRWYDLAKRHAKTDQECLLTKANFVIFHLISMNAVTNFSEIERLARREGVHGSIQQEIPNGCLLDVKEAVIHAGQVLRLVREMPQGLRPLWWPGAIYRAALVLWTGSPTCHESLESQSPMAVFSIDELPMDHHVVQGYLSRKEGIPTMTKRDRTPVPLNNAVAVLFHCIDVIDEGVATRLSEGIREKLEKLARQDVM